MPLQCFSVEFCFNFAFILDLFWGAYSFPIENKTIVLEAKQLIDYSIFGI